MALPSLAGTCVKLMWSPASVWEIDIAAANGRRCRDTAQHLIAAHLPIDPVPASGASAKVSARARIHDRTTEARKLFTFMSYSCPVIEGHLMPAHVHMGIAMRPKYPVASVIGFLKGKSAIAVARLCGKERNFTGEHFWVRGYAVSAVGFELEQVHQYFREQEKRGWNQRVVLKRLKRRA